MIYIEELELDKHISEMNLIKNPYLLSVKQAHLGIAKTVKML